MTRKQKLGVLLLAVVSAQTSEPELTLVVFGVFMILSFPVLYFLR